MEKGNFDNEDFRDIDGEMMAYGYGIGDGNSGSRSGHDDCGHGSRHGNSGHGDCGEGHDDCGQGHDDCGQGHDDCGQGHDDCGQGHGDCGQGHGDCGHGSGHKENKVRLKVTKFASRSTAAVCDTIDYKIVVKNVGNKTACNVKVRDNLDPNTCLIDNSFVGDGCLKRGCSFPFTIKSIEPGCSVTIEFKVLVKSKPSCGHVKNVACAEVCVCEKLKQFKSNETCVAIVRGEVRVNKSANKQEVCVGDIITYRIDIENTNNFPIFNVFFMDKNKCGTRFIPCSVHLNGRLCGDEDPNKGICIKTILEGETVTIKFDVRVISMPPSGVIRNRAEVEFQFIDRNGCKKVGRRCSNDNCIKVKGNVLAIRRSFKEVSLGELGSVNNITDLTATPKVNSVCIVNDSRNGSSDKVEALVNGQIDICVKFFETCNDPCGSFCAKMKQVSAREAIRTAVAIPESVCQDPIVCIVIDDVTFSVIDGRRICVDVLWHIVKK